MTIREIDLILYPMNHARRMICLLLVLFLRFRIIPGMSTAEVDTPGANTQTEAAETEETAPTVLFPHRLPISVTIWGCRAIKETGVNLDYCFRETSECVLPP